jgi:cell fate regulator YaaT (PSP1 superfamily)
MPKVVGIRFRNCGKIYHFEVNGFEIRKGDQVVVESNLGLSIGNVVIGIESIENPEKALKKVIRLATEKDIKQKQENENFKEETRAFCLERIMARGIPMMLVCTEVTLDRKKIIFYFTADGRIDFRELVKDLAAKFKTRIEMRQIGVRDKAKLVGGMGICGKELCCKVFLTTFEPISIKMAKQQELVLNTGKLSGVCGRLMCCLGFEYDDLVSDSAAVSSDYTESISEEEESLEIVTDEPEQKTAETVCSPVGSTVKTSVSQTEKSEEQLKPEHSKRQKRRRRRRRRRHKGKFQKSE